MPPPKTHTRARARTQPHCGLQRRLATRDAACRYDSVQMSILLYFLFILPYRLGFSIEPKGGEVVLDFIIDLLLMLDIFVNMNAYAGSSLALPRVWPATTSRSRQQTGKLRQQTGKSSPQTQKTQILF